MSLVAVPAKSSCSIESIPPTSSNQIGMATATAAKSVRLEEAYDLLRLSGSFCPNSKNDDPAPSSALSPSSPPRAPSRTDKITPTLDDILMGRGKHSQTHPGNVNMLKLVEEHRDHYVTASRKEKGVLVVELLDKLRCSGARFLKRRVAPSGAMADGWEEVSRRDTYEKLCHALRTKPKPGIDETIVGETTGNSKLVSKLKPVSDKKVLKSHHENNKRTSPPPFHGQHRPIRDNLFSTPKNSPKATQILYQPLLAKGKAESETANVTPALGAKSNFVASTSCHDERSRNHSMFPMLHPNLVSSEHSSTQSELDEEEEGSYRRDDLSAFELLGRTAAHIARSASRSEQVDSLSRAHTSNQGQLSNNKLLQLISQTNSHQVAPHLQRPMASTALPLDISKASVTTPKNKEIYHHRKINGHQEAPSSTSLPAIVPPNSSISPCSNEQQQADVSPVALDILIGYDKHFHSHPGNQKLQSLIQKHREDYNTGTRKERSALVKDILLEIRNGGSRFLILKGGIVRTSSIVTGSPTKRKDIIDEAAQTWEMAGRAEAYDIVRNLFQMKFREAKKVQQKQQRDHNAQTPRRSSTTSESSASVTNGPRPLTLPEISNDPPTTTTVTEALPAATSTYGDKVLAPTTNDILMGRGRHAQTHPGNLKMLYLVDRYRESYNHGQRKQKGQIVREILKIIASGGARFIKRQQTRKNNHNKGDGSDDKFKDKPSNGGEYWEEATASEVHEKLCHALRTKTRPNSQDNAMSMLKNSPKNSQDTTTVASGGAGFQGSSHDPTTRRRGSHTVVLPKPTAAVADTAISMAVQEYLLRKQD